MALVGGNRSDGIAIAYTFAIWFKTVNYGS